MKFFTADIHRRKIIARCGILFRQLHPWDPVPRGCVTSCKLFGYQLRAPRRLVLQVVNELRPSIAVRRIQSSGKSFVTAFDLHSGRPSCTTCGIDARSLAVASINNELQSSLTGLNILCSRKFSDSEKNSWIRAL